MNHERFSNLNIQLYTCTACIVVYFKPVVSNKSIHNLCILIDLRELKLRSVEFTVCFLYCSYYLLFAYIVMVILFICVSYLYA